MKKVIVRYKVKAEKVLENEKLVKEVYKELHQQAPHDLSYATYKLEDGLTFIHVAAHPEGNNPLAGLQAFKNFQKDIKDRCDEGPVVHHVEEIGSYRGH